MKMAFNVNDQGQVSLKSKYFKSSPLPTELHQVLSGSLPFSHGQINTQTRTHAHMHTDT